MSSGHAELGPWRCRAEAVPTVTRLLWARRNSNLASRCLMRMSERPSDARRWACRRRRASSIRGSSAAWRAGRSTMFRGPRIPLLRPVAWPVAAMFGSSQPVEPPQKLLLADPRTIEFSEYFAIGGGGVPSIWASATAASSMTVTPWRSAIRVTSRRRP